MRRVAFGSAFGTSLEYYDFVMYGTAAALVFGKLFFPGSSPTAAALASFATLAVGFVGRPIGGLIFGHLGDKVGRKPIMLVTLVMMGIATVGIGLLPGYASIGVWAPGLLVALRIIQGIAVGGEAAGGQLLILEHAPAGERGFYGSLVQAASPIGSVVSGGLMLVFSSTLSEEAFLSWGWRIPFLLSIVVVLIGTFVRRRVAETPVFRALKEQETVVSSPLTTVLRRNPGTVVLGILVFGTGITYYLNSVYVVSYARNLGVGSTTMLVVLTVVLFLGMLVFPFAGRAADRFGRKKVMGTGVAISLVAMVVYFPIVNTGEPVLLGLAMLLTAVGFNLFWAVQATFLAEQFDVRVRYSALAITSSLGTIVFGGLAPFLATALLSASGGSPWPIAVYGALGQLIGLAAVLALKERHDQPLDPEPAAAPGVAALEEA
jgi:MFS transporter, MHS family, shikimate and dehydroshikimate transport protein